MGQTVLGWKKLKTQRTLVACSSVHWAQPRFGICFSLKSFLTDRNSPPLPDLRHEKTDDIISVAMAGLEQSSSAPPPTQAFDAL